MTALKWFTMAFVALNITACAFDKNSNTDTKKELDDRAALYEKYNRVTGTYSGTVTAGTNTQLIEVSFFTIEKKKNDTADGQPKFLPVLMARYRVNNTTDLDQMDAFMEAKYIAETSEVFMSNTEGSLGVYGTISGQTLTGTVTRNGGRWGSLNAQLTSHESAGENNANARAERDARLRKLFEPIVGVYKGVIDFPPSSSAPDIRAGISIVIGQAKDKDGYYMPALQASYMPQQESNLILAMSVDYKSDTNPPYISLVSYEAKADYAITIAGTIQNGVIIGDFSNKRGQSGTVRFEKQRP